MPKNIIHLACLFCFLLFQQKTHAADSTAILFANALQAQTDGKHQEAIKGYEQILEGNQVSSALYNNLGLAYIQTKQLGLAIVQFERALKIEPNNSEAQHNLKAAQQRITEQFAEFKPLFFVRWWNGIVAALSSTAWAVFFLVLMCGVASGLAAWRMTQKTIFRTTAIGLAIFSTLPLLWGFQQKAVESNNSQAIIIKTQVGLRQTPELSSDEIELVFEGVKVDIIQTQDSWAHIRLSNQLIGWVPSSMLERI